MDRQIGPICTNIDDGNVKAGIRIEVGVNINADFTVNNYAAFRLKRPQKHLTYLRDHENAESFPKSD